jgi:hypothetical protein
VLRRGELDGQHHIADLLEFVIGRSMGDLVIHAVERAAALFLNSTTSVSPAVPGFPKGIEIHQTDRPSALSAHESVPCIVYFAGQIGAKSHSSALEDEWHLD